MPADKGTISSRLQLDGEQEYKKALNDAYRTLRVLRSELKAESAELGKNATAQEKARVKSDALKKQIEQQKKIVETLKKALEDSKKEYADNQEVQDKWEEKLNKAREALAKMQTEMEDANDALKGFGSSMKDAASGSAEAATHVISLNDSIKSIGTLVSGIGSGMSSVFTNTVSVMESMVDRMMELMGQAWGAAGEWKQIQSIWGGNVEDIEKVFTGASLQGVSSGDITSGIQKLVTNVHAGNKETMKALKQLGIEEKDYDNHWDFYMDVMQELANRDDDKLIRAIFGDKAGSGQTDVVHNWNEMMSKYQTDVEDTGLKLYEDEIDELDEVAHKITEVQGLWNTLKTNIGAKLTDILDMSGLSDDVLDILRTIGAIFNEKDETKRAELTMKLDAEISKLLTDVSEAMGNLGGWLEEIGSSLSGSDNSLTAFIGSLIEKAGGLLQWISEHGDQILDWLDKTLPFFLANKTSEALTGKGLGDWATSLLGMGLSIAQIKLLGSKFGASAATAVGASGLGQTLGSSAATSMGAASIGKTIGLAFLKAVPILAGLYTLLNPGETEDDAVIDKETGELTEFAKSEGYTMDENGNVVRPEAQPAVIDLGGAGERPDSWKRIYDDQMDLTEDQLKAAEEYYDALKAQSWMKNSGAGTEEADADVITAYNGMVEAFNGYGGMTDVMKRIQQLVDKPTYYNQEASPEDLPSNFFQSAEKLAEGSANTAEAVDDLGETIKEYYDEDSDLYVEEIEEAVGNVEGMLKNYTEDKYKGDKTEQQAKIELTNNVTTPIYLDGSLIAEHVSANIAEKLGRFVF